jgi:hypothetical protein
LGEKKKTLEQSSTIVECAQPLSVRLPSGKLLPRDGLSLSIKLSLKNESEQQEQRGTQSGSVLEAGAGDMQLRNLMPCYRDGRDVVAPQLGCWRRRRKFPGPEKLETVDQNRSGSDGERRRMPHDMDRETDFALATKTRRPLNWLPDPSVEESTSGCGRHAQLTALSMWEPYQTSLTNV